MKNRIALLSLIVLTSIAAFMIIAIVKSNTKTHSFDESIEKMPDFKLLNDGEIFTKDCLYSSYKTLFIYFKTDCFYCQNEMEQLLPVVDKIKGVQIILVTSESLKMVMTQPFVKSLILKRNVWLFRDVDLQFYSVFHVSIVPTLYYYNEQQHLIVKHVGIEKFDELLELILNKK